MKHRKDHRHGKNGFIAGNYRYRRTKPTKKMGRATRSLYWK